MAGPAADGLDVLLVDDDQDVLSLLSAHLTNAGLAVDVARTGNEALEKIEARRPGVVVADVRMPGMNGYELCRAVRALGHDELPFIFCSALGRGPERVLGLRLGADEYLVKPTEPDELVLRVRSHLERARRLREWRRRAEERTQPGVLTGTLGPIGVPDLFQVLDTLGVEEARIRVERLDGNWGEVWVSGRTLVHAATNAQRGRRAFRRMLSWNEGRFLIDRAAYTGAPSMAERLEACLLEGVARLDECRALRTELDPSGAGFALADESERRGRPLDDQSTQILGLVKTHRHLDRIVELSPLEDLETLRALAELLAAGVVVAWGEAPERRDAAAGGRGA